MSDEHTYGFNRDDAAAMIQGIGNGESSYPEIKPRSGVAENAVVLDDALAAATDSMRGATSGLATVLVWSIEDEEYTETEEQLTVWNHSESTAHAVDTFGTARWINGHYWFLGDCDAMADREGA